MNILLLLTSTITTLLFIEDFFILNRRATWFDPRVFVVQAVDPQADPERFDLTALPGFHLEEVSVGDKSFQYVPIIDGGPDYSSHWTDGKSLRTQEIRSGSRTKSIIIHDDEEKGLAEWKKLVKNRSIAEDAINLESRRESYADAKF